MPSAIPPLYDRLGGAPAVEAVSTALYERIMDDPLLAWAFDGVDMESQAKRMCGFLALATGGPEGYVGPPLDQVHARLHLTDREFDAVLGHVAEVLAELGVGSREIGQAAALVGSTRAMVLAQPGTCPVPAPAASSAPVAPTGAAPPAEGRRWLWRRQRAA